MSLNAGDDPKTLQSNLGHATAAFTLDVYGQVPSRFMRKIVCRLRLNEVSRQ